MQTPHLRLNQQDTIPQLGLGTWQIRGEECRNAVYEAIRIGYRHIDTADAYHNHANVAAGLNDAALERNEYFLTSKVWREDLAYQDLMDSCKRALEELDTDYLDLFLMHWPNKNIPMEDSLSAMRELKSQGLIKAIGVSNFTVTHLKEALATDTDIAMNQVEFHPSLYQRELKQYCDEQNIQMTAYSPLARGQDLKLESVQKIAKDRNVDPAQVIINWVIQKDMVVIPKSTNPDRIESNYQALKWELSDDEMQRIDDENTDNRLISPDFAEFEE